MALNRWNRRARRHRPQMQQGHRTAFARRLSTAAFGAVAILGAAACAAQPPEVTVDDPVLVNGRDVYGRNCASCHGVAGDGGVGRKLSQGTVSETFPNIADQIELVGDGRNAMPSYKNRLTAEQIEAVVRYTREVL